MTDLSPEAEEFTRATLQAAVQLDPVEAVAALTATVNTLLEWQVLSPADRLALRRCAQATLAELTPAEARQVAQTVGLRLAPTED